MTPIDEVILHYWPVFMVASFLIAWGARLETKLRTTIARQADYIRRHDKLEEQIRHDLAGIKADSGVIKATLERIQGYMEATREFQERKR